jgi:suppressor for copper-sensitivity B
MHFHKIILSLLFIAFSGSNIALASSSNWVDAYENSAKVRLIGSFYEKDVTKKLIAGLHFKIQKGWKIYGLDAEGFGLPPQLNLEKSQNYQSHKIIWPQAKIAKEDIGDEIIQYSYYNNEVVLPIEITLNDSSKNTNLNLELNYGICKDICIPASAEFSLKIDQTIDSDSLAKIQPFYQKTQITKVALESKLEIPSLKTLIYAAILGIIGGAILNIMPCVLPVLSIKLISIVSHSNAHTSRIRFSFFSTIVGILASFFFFGSFAAAVISTGHSLGWGLQFQDPYFLLFLIAILTLFTANLFGLFEISFQQVWANFLNRKISQESKETSNIFMPNFLSGVLAVLLATPCSAPFLGSAISFALVNDSFTIITIFLAIGIGFASPYIILLFAPQLVSLLPKPGMWMIKVKKLMALLLIATIIWLIYILSNNLGDRAALAAAILSTLAILSFKIKYPFLRVLAVGSLIIGLFSLPSDLNGRNEKTLIDQKYDSAWETFSEEKIEKYVNDGRVVLVDITADWCLTCKFNKVRTLRSAEITELLESGQVIGLRADLTRHDDKILDFMKTKGRFAIPFNAVYGPNAKNGLLTSELLSKTDLLELINQAR